MVRKKVETQEQVEQEKTLTRAQKTEATKGIVKELLSGKPMRHNELIDEVAKEYVHRHENDSTENMNDVKGRVGSVLDIMKKESDVGYDGGMYALKARIMPAPVEKNEEETPVKKPVRKKKETSKDEKVEASAPKKRGRPKKEVEKAEAPIEAKAEEKPAPKKTKKAVSKAETTDKIVTPSEIPQKEEKEEKKESVPVSPPAPAPAPSPLPTPIPVPAKEEKGELVVAPKAEVAQKNTVMDMSFLFGAKPQKAAPPTQKAELAPMAKKEEPDGKKTEKAEVKTPVSQKQAPKTEGKKPQREARTPVKTTKTAKPQTADEKLKESFLKRMRTLGGDYFEYYSVYLLERYSMKNGRRLEGMKISGGDHDGGIDGEIELTDKLGFKETIYIQSKNWDPEKGKEDNWVVGETLLQQFIGACACRQAKDGKQHTRGIFITTSRYTPEAKRILEDMSDKIVGYDGNDLYEAAKECEFGIVKKNGEWTLDEKLLSGPKAFFQMY